MSLNIEGKSLAFYMSWVAVLIIVSLADQIKQHVQIVTLSSDVKELKLAMANKRQVSQHIARRGTQVCRKHPHRGPTVRQAVPAHRPMAIIGPVHQGSPSSSSHK